MAPRYFTLDEANALVPTVSARMERIGELHQQLRSVAESLDDAGTPLTQAVLADEATEGPAPVLRLQLRARALYDAIREELDLLEEVGAQVKDVTAGLVDFPSLRDGAVEVLLCWQLGETQISYYHDERTGFSGRQPVEGHEFLGAPRILH